MRFNYICLALIGILMIYQWFHLEPTIGPDDVMLDAILKSSKLSAEPRISPTETYVVEIKLDRRASLPLSAPSDNQYYHIIYPYIKGFSNAGWDFYQGTDERGSIKGGEGYTFGADGRTVKMAAEQLAIDGMIDGVTEPLINELCNKLLGFTYSLDKYPTRNRIYLTPNDKKPDPNSSRIIYVHYEKKWGKDLSWSRSFPVIYKEER